jgi:hypothetical protein
MMKTTLLAAAAATAMLIAAPAVTTPAAAKDMTHSTAKSKQIHAKHSKHVRHKHMSRMSTDRTARADIAYGNGWNRPMHSGFAPFDLAGNVVGGAIGAAGTIAGTAIGTAGAIAEAPFGAGPYAYDASESDYASHDSYDAPGYRYDGMAVQYSPSYAARNGFVCQPGTWFRDENGRQRICQ